MMQFHRGMVEKCTSTSDRLHKDNASGYLPDQ
jgi:hypothetical protein